MEKQVLTENRAEVHFAKVVATPTPLSWSQIYNAGSLFAVLSLNYKDLNSPDIPVLTMIGKDVFNSLEEEYFTLEAKNFPSIKDAIAKSLEKIPLSVEPSFLIAAIPPGKDQLLYLYLIGKGSILLKRLDKTGTLLQSSEELQSASGILQDKDLVILQTDEFAKTIPYDTLVSSLDLSPSDAAEVFAAKIHQGQDGKEAALLIAYHKITPVEEVAMQEEPNIAPIDPIFPTYEMPSPKKTFSLPNLIPLVNIFKNALSKIPLQLSHTRKMFLTIAVVLTVALAATGYLVVKRQQDTKSQEEVQRILQNAEKKYNEGQVLTGLNKNFAHDDFQEAKKILEEGKNTFSKGSKEENQINEYLAKVTAALSSSSNIQTVTAKEVSLSKNTLLQVIKEKNALGAVATETSLFYLTKNAVFSADLNAKNEKEKITDVGKNPVSLGVFGSNIYVLDPQSNQIYKFVPSGSEYSKTNYLSKDTDLSKAVSMSIDSSIWVLSSNGVIQKFTKGAQESFTITGLTPTLSQPSRIYTTSDSTLLYILDPKNSRIVAIGKNGTYQAAYNADILKNAKDFTVDEKGKKIYVLSSGKLYELPLP